MDPASADPLTARHCWPLSEEAGRFEWGHVLSSVVTDLIEPSVIGGLNLHHAGCWECDLKDNSLIWSGGVYDLFGLPRGSTVSRDEALSFYGEDSRAKIERLRSFAIRHRRGFTLDAQIRPAVGGTRLMRLIAAPVWEDGEVVRLHGLKLLV